MNPLDEQLSPAQVARMLGVTTETLRRWRRLGSGPVARRVGPRLVRYDRVAVQAWLDR
ncbi:MAG: helix-turn-helix domain-containing protein, partial [Actinomycetia bacterium]|nr:helix-turn-helix domain-containing protein [Actinomycetes bacterium]